MKYSEQLVDWLEDEGYSHCFFVAGGNIVHLLDAVRTRMTCVPFVHEVGAAIAAEYFTESTSAEQGKAFVLVTAGPGFTNLVTALAGAWLESRELLVIGGQVKSSDLSMGEVRQLGIQEIDGIAASAPFTKTRLQITAPISRDVVMDHIRAGVTPRKGPVFIEVSLDAQGAPALPASPWNSRQISLPDFKPKVEEIDAVAKLFEEARRPVLLIGSGISREIAFQLQREIGGLGVPVMLTWNAADRLPDDFPLNFGRPNIWGQRYSNILLQQADLLVAIGTRLGIQQTGFAWDSFVPNGKIVQVDIDLAELEKINPRKDVTILADAASFLHALLARLENQLNFDSWVLFCQTVRKSLPTSESINAPASDFINPYELMLEVSEVAKEGDIVIPSSSGASFTVAMQAFRLKSGQKMITNKGLASMGYGLSGSIGASLSNRFSTTWLFEGDGGFSQNLQELGTVAAQKLNLKMLIMANNGYASIRMTQRNYFNGSWIGCDTSTGLGLPNLEQLAGAFGLSFVRLSPDKSERLNQLHALNENSLPVVVEVPIDPEQNYYPKISSRALPNGSMVSNPLHMMDPQLPEPVEQLVFRYLEPKETNTNE